MFDERPPPPEPLLRPALLSQQVEYADATVPNDLVLAPQVLIVMLCIL
jgi:hypothetical protein